MQQAHSNDMQSQGDFVEDFDEAKEESAAQQFGEFPVDGSRKAGESPAGPVDEALAEKDAIIQKLTAANQVSGVFRTDIMRSSSFLFNVLKFNPCGSMSECLAPCRCWRSRSKNWSSS